MRMLIEIVRQSLATLWAHKLRSFLTMFGIAWGVGSLLLLVGLGEGFRSGQAKQLKNLGQDIMFTFPGRIRRSKAALSPDALITSLMRITSLSTARPAPLSMFRPYSTARTFAPSAIMFHQRPGLRHRARVQPDSHYPRWPGPLVQRRRQYRNAASGRRRLGVIEEHIPGRPAVGSPILLNGIRLKLSACSAKSARTATTAPTRASSFRSRPMRNLFRLKEENSEDAISFLNYRPLTPTGI